jgi:hypothetical protein
MSEITTMKVYKRDIPWIRLCCKVKGMIQQELISEFRKEVNARHKQKFYDSLPKPEEYVKPLQGIKIKKKYAKNRYIL